MGPLGRGFYPVQAVCSSRRLEPPGKASVPVMHKGRVRGQRCCRGRQSPAGLIRSLNLTLSGRGVTREG